MNCTTAAGKGPPHGITGHSAPKAAAVEHVNVTPSAMNSGKLDAAGTVSQPRCERPFRLQLSALFQSCGRTIGPMAEKGPAGLPPALASRQGITGKASQRKVRASAGGLVAAAQGRANIVARHVADDFDVSQPRWQHEPQLAALDLFVVVHQFDQLFVRHFGDARR